MMGKTHLAGGTLAMLGAYYVGQKYGVGLKDVNPLIQLAVMFPFASAGSILPDMDQGSIDSCPSKTPMAMTLHKVLHIGGHCYHRSWMTHCWLITLSISAMAYGLILWSSLVFNATETALLLVIVTGLTVGNISHLFLDTLTMAGTHIIPNVMFRLVPKTEAFGTDSNWEILVRRICYVLILVLSIEVFVGFDVLSGYFTGLNTWISGIIGMFKK